MRSLVLPPAHKAPPRSNPRALPIKSASGDGYTILHPEDYCLLPPNVTEGQYVLSSTSYVEEHLLPKYKFWEREVLPSLEADLDADPAFYSFARFNALHPTSVEPLLYFRLDTGKPWTPDNTWISQHSVPLYKYKNRLWSWEALATEFNMDPTILRCLLFRYPDPVVAYAYYTGTPVPDLPPCDTPFTFRPPVIARKMGTQLKHCHWRTMDKGTGFLDTNGIWDNLEARIQEQGYLGVSDFLELAGLKFTRDSSKHLTPTYIDHLHVCALSGLGHFALLTPDDPYSVGLVRDYDNQDADTSTEAIILSLVRYACNEDKVQTAGGKRQRDALAWTTEESLNRVYFPFRSREYIHDVLRAMVNSGAIADYLPESEALDPLYVTPGFLEREPKPTDKSNAAASWRHCLKSMERAAVPGLSYRNRTQPETEPCIMPWEPGFDPSLLDTVRGTQMDSTPNKTPYIYPGA